MGDQTTNPTQAAIQTDRAAAESKGKGKADPQDVSMGEEEDSSDEETGAEDEAPEEPEEDDEDNMEEIDTTNIIGARTRGKNIDWNKAAEDNKGQIDDDEDDDDEDFEGEDDEMQG